LNPQNKRF